MAISAELTAREPRIPRQALNSGGAGAGLPASGRCNLCRNNLSGQTKNSAAIEICWKSGYCCLKSTLSLRRAYSGALSTRRADALRLKAEAKRAAASLAGWQQPVICGAHAVASAERFASVWIGDRRGYRSTVSPAQVKRAPSAA
jgi:hypothetical protein